MLCCKKKPMDKKPEAIVPFPDGGWGWFVCMATFTTQFIVLGTMNNFGVIYVELLKEFKNIGKDEAAVVGSLTYGLMFLLGPLATSLCQKLGCRATTMIGCIIAASGCLLGSISPNIYVMDLTYGFLFGIGASMCYFPSVVILGQYFSKRLSLANGITSSGSGVSLAIEEGIEPFKATLLIGIMSIASTLGRLLFGRIADHPRVNRLYLYQISFLMIGISNTLCPVLTSYPGLICYATAFGFFEGCYVLLAPVLTGDIVGRDKMAHGVGVLFALKSLPLTVGPILAGLIYRYTMSYQVAFYISGAVPTAAACLMFGIPFLMPDRQEDKKCRVVLAEESGFDKKPTYFDEKLAFV